MPVDICGSVYGYHTALVYAASNEHLETVKFLIERGATVDGNPMGSQTPLIAASKDGYSDVVLFLLRQNPDINRIYAYFNNMTALDLAKLFGHHDTTEILIEHGARSAQETIHFAKERASGVYECFYDNVGMILDTKFTTYEKKYRIDIRTALVDKGNKLKVLFSIGGYLKKPRKEFFLCLPAAWRLNSALLDTDYVAGFPVKIMQEVTKYWLAGNRVEEGFIIAKEEEAWKNLPWPQDIDGLVVVDYRFRKDTPPDNSHIKDGNIQNDDTVQLYALVPVTFPKGKRYEGKKLQAWLEKTKNFKWHRIAFKEEWELL
jgi:hypothetical protein